MSETKAQLCFLTTVDLTGNKLAKLRPILAKKLQYLTLDQNEITEVDFGAKGHEQLRLLSLNQNKMTDLTGITNLPCLETLSMNNNELTSLNGITGCNALKVLNLNQNKLEGFDVVPDLPGLEEISMTHCPISKIAELGKLIKYTKLRTLNVLETPLAEEAGESLKKEVLILLDGLNITMFNGEEVTKEEIDDAKQEKADRIKAAEEARKEAEEARKAAEEEARLAKLAEEEAAAEAAAAAAEAAE